MFQMKIYRVPPPPETSDWEISADLPGKERQGKGKWEKKEGKLKKECKKLKCKEGKLQNEEGDVFGFSLLKTTEIFLEGSLVGLHQKQMDFAMG